MVLTSSSRANGGITQGTIDVNVSPEGNYVAGLSIDNWFVVMPLTNGLPDSSGLFMNTPTSYSGNGRAIAWDAADNIYVSSSGLGLCQSWSLGITSLATTTGNATGATGFSVVFPPTKVNVTATSNFASQGGANGTPGTPVPGVFTITRTEPNNDYSYPITITLTLGAPQPNGVYTVSPAGITPAVGGTITLPAGVTSDQHHHHPGHRQYPAVADDGCALAQRRQLSGSAAFQRHGLYPEHLREPIGPDPGSRHHVQGLLERLCLSHYHAHGRHQCSILHDSGCDLDLFRHGGSRHGLHAVASGND